MWIRLFLGLQALLFIPYGLYCLTTPGMLAEAAGIVATSTTGTIELRTMYGGLQISVGVMCALGALRPGLERPAVYALFFIFAGLAPVRAVLAIAHQDFSGYTLFAVIFELISLSIAIWYLKSGAGRTASA